MILGPTATKTSVSLTYHSTTGSSSFTNTAKNKAENSCYENSTATYHNYSKKAHERTFQMNICLQVRLEKKKVRTKTLAASYRKNETRKKDVSLELVKL